MTSNAMTSEMTTCGAIPRDGMLRSRAVVRRSGGRNMALISTRLRFGGFTLIELLVVVGIVAVLIAILLPVLGRARAQANRAVCLSNIRQLGAAILMYCNDNKGYFPTAAWTDDGLSHMHYPEDWIHWQANRNITDSAIAKYVGRGEKLKSLLRCPVDSFDGRKTRTSSVPGQGPYLYSYGMNTNMARNWRPYGLYPHSSKITQWRVPSKKIVLGEPNPVWVLEPLFGYTVPLAQRHGSAVFHGNVPGFPQLLYGVKNGSNASIAFLDGHVESLDQDAVFDRMLFEPEAR
jgi:prepilin-type N-terminal cleavage/methylation domain-containing protein/prepilin-type processing-associated H-X9-DG protein